MGMIESSEKLMATLADKALLVFDFDGVLADSVHVKTEAYGTMYQQYGQDIASQVVEYHLQNGGVSRFDKFKLWEKQFFGRDINDQELAQLCQRFADLVVDKVVAADALPGSLAFLRQAKARGIKMTVNSATPSNEIEQIVARRGLSEYFDAVMGSPDNKQVNLRRAMACFDIQAKDVLFFGDAEADLLAAKAQGVDFVGVGAEIKALMSHHDGHFFAIEDFSALIK